MKFSGCVSLLLLLLFISKVPARNIETDKDEDSANIRIYVCDSFGSFISFNITNAIEESTKYYNDLDELVTYEEIGHIYIAYKINHGPTMLLKLQSNNNDESAFCKFHGIVNGIPELSASVDTCDGLTVTVDNEVIIGADHVIHKRSLNPQQQVQIERSINTPQLVHIDRSDDIELVRQQLAQLGDLVLEIGLVVTDSFYHIFHNHEEFMNFIFTTMKKVDEYYKDPSFGVDISIQLKSLRVLNNHETSLIDVQGSTRFTLKNFKSFKQYEDIKADVVILLSSAFDEGRGMLDQLGQKDNIGVVGWQGFETSYVLAHEVGHILGLNHPHIFCEEESKEILFIMKSGHGTDFKDTNRGWSECSRNDIPYLIRNRKMHFLTTSSPIMELGMFQYPGVHWSMERQCEISVGDGFLPEMTLGVDECGWLTCKKLLPITNEQISMAWRYRNIIPLEGTKCFGNKSWCVNYECRNKNTGKLVVHGGWSDWKVIKKCKCGEQTERRRCNNPRPRNGGVKCEGDARRKVKCFKTWNSKKC